MVLQLLCREIPKARRMSELGGGWATVPLAPHLIGDSWKWEMLTPQLGKRMEVEEFLQVGKGELECVLRNDLTLPPGVQGYDLLYLGV